MLNSKSTYPNEQAFVDSIKAYVASSDFKGFDKKSYDAAISNYMPQTVQIFDKFFDAIQTYVSNKDEQSLRKGIEEFLQYRAGDSSSPYDWAEDTRQTAFADFALKENLKSFLKEIDAFIEAGNSLETIDWTGYHNKDEDSAFVSELENYLKTRVIDQKLISAYKNVFGQDALSWAATFQQVKLASFLLENGYDFNAKKSQDALPPLGFAALSPNPKVLMEFVERGADVNATFNDYYTLLALASQNAVNTDGIKALLDRGARVDESGKNSKITPLMLASDANPNICVVEELLKAGANVNTQDSALNGSTPIMYAAMGWGGRPVMELMLAKDADLKITTHDGATVLHAAMWSANSTEPTNLLLEQKVIDVNAVEKLHGQTAVNLCARINKDGVLATLKLLVEAKADLNVVDKEGNTALDYAVENKNQEAERYLKAHGAKRASELQSYSSYAYSSLSRLMKTVTFANENKMQHPLVAKYTASTGKSIDLKDFHPSMIVHSKCQSRSISLPNLVFSHEQKGVFAQNSF